ncbi:MAG: right-handed parallel beta-helix repeat-containing protein [Pirellulales bacterium]
MSKRLHGKRLGLRYESLESRLALSTFYVSPLGADVNGGSSSDPWQTLQKAADSVRAGDTVIVRPGIYQGFDLRTDGTATAPITFQAQDGVLIDLPNDRTDRDGINLEGASYIVIEGFEIVGMPRAGIRAVGTSASFTQSIVVRGNEADKNGVWGVFTAFTNDVLIENNVTSRSAQQHGIYVSNSGDRPVIRGNTIWGNYQNGIHMNGDESMGSDGLITGAVIENNVIYENGHGGGSGINADGVQSSVFQNNLLYSNHASGISLYRINGADGSKNNLVVNNTIVQASDARWALNIQNGSTGNTVYNNILYNAHSWKGSIDISINSLPGLVSNHNVVMSRFTTDDSGSILSLDAWRSLTGQDADSLLAVAAELFVDAAAGDYHLAASSPALDRGTSQWAPARDLDGLTRPQAENWDIGAYERPTVIAPWRFDFGMAGSPVASGFTQVTKATSYSTELGYGWQQGSVAHRDRESAHPLTRDFNYTRSAVFGVDLEPGTYSVTVTLGDAAVAHDQMGVFLEGTQVGSVSTAAGQFKTRTWQVEVSDGQLTLGLKDLGGADPNVMINALEITPETSSVSSTPAAQFDFGMPASPVAGGFTRVTKATTYSTDLGYGWQQGSVAARDRESEDPLTRDFNYSRSGVFAVDLKPGTYSVSLTMGDATAPHDQMGVFLEGTQVGSVTTAAGEFKTLIWQVDVLDGQLTVGLKDLGGADLNVMINALEVALVDVSADLMLLSSTDVSLDDAEVMAARTTDAVLDELDEASDQPQQAPATSWRDAEWEETLAELFLGQPDPLDWSDPALHEFIAMLEALTPAGS